MPFGLQAPELLIILAIILVIFGAGKLPQVFGSLGKGVKEFREATEGKETAAQPPASTTTTPVVTTTTSPPAGSTTVTTTTAEVPSPATPVATTQETTKS